MKKEQFERMMRAAADIVAKAETGGQLDPHTVLWARFLVTNNPIRFRGSPLQDEIACLYTEDPSIGLTAAQIQQRLGHGGPSELTAIDCMRRTGRLIKLNWPKFSEYFISETAADAARPAFEERRRAWVEGRLLKPKPEPKPKIPRLAKTRPPRVKQAVLVEPQTSRWNGAQDKTKPERPPRIDLEPKRTAFNPNDAAKSRRTLEAAAVTIAPRKTLLHSGEAFRPAHVQVQVIPHAVDTRYQGEAPGDDSFSAEWKRLRGGAS